ncbi:MAG: DMT family transporter, partial [Agromyces sp.]
MAKVAIIWRFLAVGLVWGSGFLWNSIALESMSWQFLTWSRALVGALVLLAIMLTVQPRTGGIVWPRSVKTWLHFGVIGVLLAAIPNVFWALGQLNLSSSLASIYNATIPIATALIAGLLFRIDRLGPFQWLGIAAGITGVVVVIGPWEGSVGGGLWSQLACLVAVCSVATAFAYQRKYLAEHPLHPITAAALITFGAAAVSLVMTPVWLD